MRPTAASFATAPLALAYVLPAAPRVSLFRAKNRRLLRFGCSPFKAATVSHAEERSTEGIADFRLPIADLNYLQSEIGNWQSAITPVLRRSPEGSAGSWVLT